MEGSVSKEVEREPVCWGAVVLRYLAEDGIIAVQLVVLFLVAELLANSSDNSPVYGLVLLGSRSLHKGV